MPASHDRTPTPRVTRRRAETRRRLLSAASEMFVENGFGRTTVEDVCERAGYTRGAFYSNFGSLEEMLFTLYGDRSAAVVEAVANAVGAAVDSDERTLDAVMDAVVGALPVSRDSHLLNLEFAIHALRHPDVAAALAEQRRQLREALVPVLRLGLQAVGIPFTDSSLDDLGRAVLATQEGMYLQELLEPLDPHLPSLRRQALTAVLVNAQA
jgi:AcrR family transcriptional regulator